MSLEWKFDNEADVYTLEYDGCRFASIYHYLEGINGKNYTASWLFGKDYKQANFETLHEAKKWCLEKVSSLALLIWNEASMAEAIMFSYKHLD